MLLTPSGYPPTASGYPPTAIGYPPTASGYPPTAIGYPPTAIGYPPTAIGYPPTASGYPPTAIGYPPTAIVGRIGHSEFFFFNYGTPCSGQMGPRPLVPPPSVAHLPKGPASVSRSGTATAAEMLDSFRVNTVGAFEAAKHSYAALSAADGGGSIVFYSTIAARRGFTNHSLISAGVRLSCPAARVVAAGPGAGPQDHAAPHDPRSPSHCTPPPPLV